uniref:Replication factor A protein 3 n=1 Tax=Haptolina brevifila TaxID=156173 RepID=A0A7S2BNR4_9EUKA|eukprot:CAMPEP_0174720256 /NCGR_PEP_ID=MMETSP1094-20130205/33145_1 /TAXON_ID=156173 /ORGANISM="Chrysochromulina brevifilum, Strain UTEX LB 985" /LENGTH=113 /DNA_ID=CAMNT_0015920717 /DNA_START=40 /DNA_END=381 /DNA_ORIENTATION=+
MAAASTVRITSEHMQAAQFQGQRVRAVGRLTNVADDQIQMQLAGPEGPPTVVFCSNSMHKYSPDTVGKGCYEVIGTLSNGSITEMQTVYMGDNFDMGMYAEMVSLTHQFPDIF